MGQLRQLFLLLLTVAGAASAEERDAGAGSPARFTALVHLPGSDFNLMFMSDGTLLLWSSGCAMDRKQWGKWTREGERLQLRATTGSFDGWPVMTDSIGWLRRDPSRRHAGAGHLGWVSTESVPGLSARIVEGAILDSFGQKWERAVTTHLSDASDSGEGVMGGVVVSDSYAARFAATNVAGCEPGVRYRLAVPDDASRQRWDAQVGAAYESVAERWERLLDISPRAFPSACLVLDGSSQYAPGCTAIRGLGAPAELQATFARHFANEGIWSLRATKVPLWLESAVNVALEGNSITSAEEMRAIYQRGGDWGELPPGPARLAHCASSDLTSYSPNPWAVLALRYIRATRGSEGLLEVLLRAETPSDLARLPTENTATSPDEIVDFERGWDAWVRHELGTTDVGVGTIASPPGSPNGGVPSQGVWHFEVRTNNELWMRSALIRTPKRIWRGANGERYAAVTPSPDRRFLLVTVNNVGSGETWYAVHRVSKPARRALEEVAEQLGFDDEAMGVPVWVADAPATLRVRMRRGAEEDLDVTQLIWGAVACEPKLVTEVIDSHLKESRDCFDPLAKKVLDPAGKVAITFTIDAEGHVMDPAIEQSTLPGDQVGRCLMKHLTRWTFPKPIGASNCLVEYPWIFKTAASSEAAR
jgi:hypothetical protein